MPRLTYRGLIFLGLCIIFIFALFFRTNTAVIVKDLMADFAISAASLGLMASAFFYAYGAVQIPVGLLSDRIGVQHTVFCFSLLGVAGCIMFALSTGLHMATWARALIGIGTAGIWIPSLKYLAISYKPDEFVTRTGIINAIGGLGLILATLPMAVMVERIGWRLSYIIPSLIMLALVIALYRLMKFSAGSSQKLGSNALEEQNKGGRKEKSSFSPDRSFWHHPMFWRFALWAFLIYGVLFSFQSLWGVSYLQETFGKSRELAGTLLMFVSIGGICGGVVWGLLSERFFRARRPVLLLGTIGMAGAYVALLFLRSCYPGDSAIASIYFLLGLCGFTFLLNLGCVKEFFPLEIAGTAMGTVNASMFMGVAAFQGITGYIIGLFSGDALTAYRVVFSLYLGSIILAGIMVIIMPETFPKTIPAADKIAKQEK